MDNDVAAIEMTHEAPLLERLYREHVPRNVRIAYLLTGDLEVSRELVHDAYLRTSSRLHTLRNPHAFGAYMTRTVVNMSKRHRERRGREDRYAAHEAKTAMRHSLQPDVATRDELLTALRTLPHRQRTALVLRFYSDLPEVEIAEALGCAVGTVRSLISRGLVALRDLVGGDR